MDDQNDFSTWQASGYSKSQDTGGASKTSFGAGSSIEDSTESTNPAMKAEKRRIGKGSMPLHIKVEKSPLPNEELSQVFIDAILRAQKEPVLEFIRQGVDLNGINGRNISSRGANYPPLIAAVSSESLEIITVILDAGANVNASVRGSFGSALGAAAASNSNFAPRIIRLLIDRGADVNMRLIGESGSALAAAALRGSPDNIQALVQADVDVNMQLEHGHYGSALAAAAAVEGSLDNIQALVQADVDVNMRLKHGYYGSALAAAAIHGSPDNIQALVQAGADVNMQLEHGHYGSALAAAAAVEGSLDNIQALVQADVDVNMRLKHGYYGSALAAAAIHGSPDNIQAIVQAGADVNLRLEHGHYGSALAAAAAVEGSLNNIQALVKADVDVNMRLEHGYYGSALAAAAIHGSPDSIQALVQAGADVDMRLEHGHYGSALAAAAEFGSADNIQTLIEAGADVNLQLTHGEYGSALAVARSKIAVEQLLQKGANVNMEIEHGSYQNALAAALHKRRDTVERLLRAGATIGPLASTQIKRSDTIRMLIKQSNPTINGTPKAQEFIIRWELPSILDGIREVETHLSHMGTLTRKIDTVALAPCRDFLRSSYGDFGLTLLRGIVRALKSSQHLYLDGNVELETSPFQVYLRATDMTPDALRILEWICLTFRKPIEHALCTSTLSRSGARSELKDLFPFKELPEDTRCWYQLFDTGVVAFEPSIEKLMYCRGLELDFNQLLRISAVEYPVLVDSGLILMGYSTALIPVKLTEDGRIIWHLEVAKDEFQLQVSDLKVTKSHWLRDTQFEYLQGKTAVLGWCSESEILLGTDRLKPNIALSDATSKPVSWRWGGANLQLVAQSASPLALGGQLGFTFDRCINSIQFNPSNNYLKCLSNSARQHIVLYDVTAKRAWLVSLLSVLHHMLLVWSERSHKEFKKAPPPTATPGPDYGLASLNALRDQGGLVLDSSGDDITTVRELIMGFSVNLSKAALHAPKGLKVYGYEFLDIVMESPESELKKAKLEKQGLGWTSLLNESKCLFCSNLGDVIIGKRSHLPLSPCNTLVEGYDLMAASVHSIETLSKKYGGKTHGSTCRLSQTHFWHLAGSPFQSCQHGHNDGSCWNRPELLGEFLQEIKSQPPRHPNEKPDESFIKGALVFGGQARSKTFFNRAQSAETYTVSIRGMVR